MISGWDFNPPPKWYRLPHWLKSHLTRASGILRGNISTNDWDTQHDDDRFLDLNQFVSALFAELPDARMKVTDIMHMSKLDNKNRFELLVVAGQPIGPSKSGRQPDTTTVLSVPRVISSLMQT